jgi:ribose-phosphate pyrophosphokinase
MKYLKLDDLICDIGGENIIKFKTLKFSGGEQHITLEKAYKNHEESYKGACTEVTIEVRLTNSDKVMLLFLATDALRREGYEKISVFTPYLPYARQDRVCNVGEALSIKVICTLINSQNYCNVYTLDNHSEVSTALLNNCVELNTASIIMDAIGENSIPKAADFKRYALVSPDAGALKKTYNLSKAMGGIPVIQCSKKRDVTNGDILGVSISNASHDVKQYENLIIVDDICDGGRTFIELAKELRKHNGGHIKLFVSHGIFSKGTDVFKGLIEQVYTTNSFENNYSNVITYKFEEENIK